jgi:xylulokinase
MARAAAEVNDAIEPLAICVTGHGPSLTAVAAGGTPVRPAITWLDTRARAELVELEAATGLRGWALGVLPAALWLERHEPDVAARAVWYLNSWEAIALRLCGRAATSVVPGGVGLPIEAIAGSGLTVERLPAEVEAGVLLGALTSGAAGHLGIPGGTPVVAGLVDAFASFDGARMLAEGDAIDVGGSAGGFGVYAARPIAVRGGFTTAAPLPGLFSVGGAMAATGASLDWFANDVLGGTVAIDRLIDEAAGVPPGAAGLVFLPYLAGERSPIWDPTARGAFVGLALGHGRGHLARAILEASAFAIRHVAEPILAAGISVREMRVCGGPARRESWNQIKADVTGFPVDVPSVLETAVVGAAVLGAVGIGAYPDVPAGIRGMTRMSHRLEPNPGHRDLYDTAYDAYIRLHPAIAPIVRGLAAERRITEGAA